MTNVIDRRHSFRACRRMLFLSFVFSTQLLLAQNDAAAGPKLIAAGRKLFAEQCAACHGTDAQGSDRAPRLAGSRRVRARSMEDLRNVISHGIPAAGMPAFNLPTNDLNALAAFVHSLNAENTPNPVSGVASAGREFFFGKGRCASCHMVYGQGSPIGPDLSNVGGEMTVEELRNVLLNPGSRITPGYELVTVHLQNGAKIRGFARGRTSFDIQLQDLEGRFHLLDMNAISVIQDEKQTIMPATKASEEELRNLLSYLSELKGVQPGALDPAAQKHQSHSEEVDFARIKNPHAGDWLTYNGPLSGNRYSDLSQINTTNANKLAVQWIFPVPHFGLEVTPVVADGIMYITGPNQAFALDARTGRQIWKYSRERTPGLIGDASLGTNRGVALLGDKVFMVTDNAHLIALNRITGSLVWDIVMPDEPQHYGSTVAPLIVKDMVIAGVSGGDRGIRGFFACYKADTGERVWKRWIIPGKGEQGHETWKGKEPTFGGGATWLTGTYAPDTNTLYWPTGNPFPDSDDRDRPGDNLFTDCMLALNPDTGEFKWYYQFTPHDVRDWDANEPPVLVDSKFQGQDRKLLLQANRNGFFYVMDRTNGKVLLAHKFVHRLTWASGVGSDGRPQLLPGYLPPSEGEETCPEDATNWNATAFSPVTRLYFVMSLEACRFDRAPEGSGSRKHNSNHTEYVSEKYLRAIDIDTGKVAWEIPQFGTVYPKTWPGVLATAGGIVFYGDPNGAFAAVDEQHGNPLWHFPTNVPMKASPMTYMVDGKQYVAVVAGPNIMCFGLPQ
jgi:PQQ-dependent dehydrogenase (methanol/ethanol family)